MTRYSSRRALLVGVTVLALLATACGTGDDQADGGGDADGDGRSISLLMPFFPPAWESRSTAGALNTVQLAVTEPLVAYGADGSFTPLLASEVDHPDPTTYIYTVRTDIEFSDGTPLTLEDVQYSFELHMGEDNPSWRARFFAAVDSVELVGDDQVKVTLTEPDPEFDFAVASLGIVSKANYEAHPDDIGSPSAPEIGTGPYVVVESTPSASITLQRNPDYWGEPPAYEEVTFGIASDDSSRLLALQSGDYHGIIAPPVGQVPAIQGLGTYTEYKMFDPTVYRVIFDLTKAPFDDIHVRRAIAHAINREDLVSGVFGGRAELTQSVVPESVIADLDGEADVSAIYEDFAGDFEFDMEAAASELAKSSTPDGFSIEVPVFSDDPAQALVVQVMDQSLSELGIDLTPKQVDLNGWTEVFTGGASDGMIVDQWTGGSPDPATIPRSLFTPGSIGNFSQLDVPEVNDALAAYVAADGDESVEQESLLDALVAAQAEVPYVPLAFLSMYMYLDDDTRLVAQTPFFWMVPFADTFAPAG